MIDIQKNGKICLLDIDVKGARDVHSHSNIIECNYIFVKTPTIEELKLRLMKRASETQESLDKRIRNAETEINVAERMGIF